MCSKLTCGASVSKILAIIQWLIYVIEHGVAIIWPFEYKLGSPFHFIVQVHDYCRPGWWQCLFYHSLKEYIRIFQRVCRAVISSVRHFI